MNDKDKASGWIMLDRDIRDHWLYSERPYSRFQAWIDLIFSANFRDKDIMINGKPERIRRGSFLTSTRKLSIQWGWSRNKVIRFLDTLRDENMITTRTRGGTILTIVNYSVYQIRRDSHGATHGATREASDGATLGTQENKGIRENKVNKGNCGLSAPECDPDEDEVSAEEYWKRKEEEHGTV
jgi:hypothetical protein